MTEKEEEKKPQFAALPLRVIRDKRLSARDQRILMAISMHDRFGKNGVGCCARLARISAIACVSENHASTSIKSLERLGYVEMRKGCTDKRLRTYRVRYIWEQDKAAMQVAGNEFEQDDTGANPLAEMSKPTAEFVAAEFERFWEIFPKRRKPENKKKALKFFTAARNKVDLETILKGAQNYKRFRDGEDAKYTQNPSTWLDDECWNDEYEDEEAARQRAWGIKDFTGDFKGSGYTGDDSQWDTTVDLSPVQPPEKGPQPADQVSERILPVDGGGVEVPPLRDGEGLPSPVKNEDETPEKFPPESGSHLPIIPPGLGNYLSEIPPESGKHFSEQETKSAEIDEQNQYPSGSNNMGHISPNKSCETNNTNKSCETAPTESAMMPEIGFYQGDRSGEPECNPGVCEADPVIIQSSPVKLESLETVEQWKPPIPD